LVSVGQVRLAGSADAVATGRTYESVGERVENGSGGIREGCVTQRAELRLGLLDVELDILDNGDDVF